MNFMIQHLNDLGAKAISVAFPILWQSSLLIGLMLVVEWTLGRKLPPGARYVLWLVVMLKLILPPSLALPTSIAWWVRPHAATPPTHSARVFVTYGPLPNTPAVPVEPALMPFSPRAQLSAPGAVFAATSGVSLALFMFMLWRWRKVGREATVRADMQAPPWLNDLLQEACRCAGIKRQVGLGLLEGPVSPAVFGLVRPLILLPEALVQRLSRAQLRSVLLHELIHLRRGDVWVNCAQALVQMVYWWHPLVWVANSRIRRAREEAVDEAVMLALRSEAEDYAPTLVEVARLALHRPLASLGLIGILESHRALRQRIERLLNFHPPRRAGITLVSTLCAVAFGALALPMGPAPENKATQDRPAEQDSPRISLNNIQDETKSEAKVLVQDGKLLFEMGKLDEAEKKLQEALRQDPLNQAAYYYLNLVNEARDKQNGQGPIHNSSGRQRIYSKLSHIRLNTVEFDQVPLADALKTLADETRRNDPEKAGINFILSQGSPATTQDIARVTIRIVPSLVDVRVADVLDAIVKVADRPIKYSVEDYGIVFSFKTKEAVPLYVRAIKVDPNTLRDSLRSVMNQPEGGALNIADTYRLLREFLASINVDLAPPKSLFWTEREGTILVRASLQDLDAIETAIQSLNIAPAQVHIKARFIEMSEADEASFWKTHPDAKISPTGASTIQLTPEETQKQLAAWESTHSADMLGNSSIVTLSGRQAQVQIAELKTVVTYTNLLFVTNQIPLGPTLDITPTLSADAFRFDLALKATLTEFLGYDDPGPLSTGPNGARARPLPHFRIRQMSVTATVWDGDTVVIGGALDEQNAPTANSADSKKRLLVVVTPTAVDPAGNRVHTDEEVANARAGLRR